MSTNVFIIKLTVDQCFDLADTRPLPRVVHSLFPGQSPFQNLPTCLNAAVFGYATGNSYKFSDLRQTPYHRMAPIKCNSCTADHSNSHTTELRHLSISLPGYHALWAPYSQNRDHAFLAQSTSHRQPEMHTDKIRQNHHSHRLLVHLLAAPSQLLSEKHSRYAVADIFPLPLKYQAHHWELPAR